MAQPGPCTIPGCSNSRKRKGLRPDGSKRYKPYCPRHRADGSV